jgi:hypothetical protein
VQAVYTALLVLGDSFVAESLVRGAVTGTTSSAQASVNVAAGLHDVSCVSVNEQLSRCLHALCYVVSGGSRTRLIRTHVRALQFCDQAKIWFLIDVDRMM